MELRIIKVILFFVVILTGCYYDVEEELYSTLDCQTAEMSYEKDIKPIIEMDCYGCHSAAANFGNVTLEDYEELLKYVNNSALLGVIKHEKGFSPMPKNQAMLLECEIEKIESWIADGARNN